LKESMAWLTAHLNNEKNCFVTVCHNLKFINSNSILLCEWFSNYPKNIFVTPAPDRITRSGIIEFSSSFASCIGILEGTKVYVTEVDVSKVQERKKDHLITFIPTTKNDYDIIEQNQEELTICILKQINVICKHEFPIWLGEGIYIRLKCENYLPSNFSCLYEGCEISIKTKIFKKKISRSSKNKSHWMRIQYQFSKTLKTNHVVVNNFNMKQQKWKTGDFLTLFYLCWDENSRSCNKYYPFSNKAKQFYIFLSYSSE